MSDTRKTAAEKMAWSKQPVSVSRKTQDTDQNSDRRTASGTATHLLQDAIKAMHDRASSRDLPDGERSMARTVAAFNALTGTSLSETQGWLFMTCLKQARATAGAFNADDYVDLAAYAALAGEAAQVTSPDPINRAASVVDAPAGVGLADAINFVGLVYKDGRIVVSQGTDCHFDDPIKQCPYHDLSFHSGPRVHACRVIDAYRLTYSHHAALRMLVWALGGHLKAVLGFWPHMSLQGPKAAGKSVLVLSLKRSIDIRTYCGEQIDTTFRLLCSMSNTGHPVGWTDIDTINERAIDAAVNFLHDAYQSRHTVMGSERLNFLISAPVLVNAEDMPLKSLTEKMVVEDLTSKTKGEMLPEDLPRFPVRNWLEYLAATGPDALSMFYKKWGQYIKEQNWPDSVCETRIISNYAAVMTAADLLFDFAGCHDLFEDFLTFLLIEMRRQTVALAAALGHAEEHK